jgi:hypothetical protein
MPFSPKLFLELHMLGFDSVLQSGRQSKKVWFAFAVLPGLIALQLSVFS